MLAYETVERGMLRCCGIPWLQTVGRGASGSRRLRRWGEGPRGPVARPWASSFLLLRGATPGFLPGILLVSSLVLSWFHVSSS